MRTPTTARCAHSAALRGGGSRSAAASGARTASASACRSARNVIGSLWASPILMKLNPEHHNATKTKGAIRSSRDDVTAPGRTSAWGSSGGDFLQHLPPGLDPKRQDEGGRDEEAQCAQREDGELPNILEHEADDDRADDRA